MIAMDSRETLDILQLSPLNPIPVPFENPSEQSIANLSQQAKIQIQKFKLLLSQKKSETEVDQALDEINLFLEKLNKKRLYEFILAVNREIESFNQLIEEFNRADRIETKTHLLQAINQKTTELDSHFPESVIARSPEYREQFYQILNTEIRQNFRHLTQITSTATDTPYQYRLSELLAKMSQEQLNKFLSILCGNTHYTDELETLYSETDPNYPEFMEFLQTHSISYIGGKNSNNFQIHRLGHPEESYILKIEDRINQPKDISMRLSAEVDNIIIPELSLRAYFEGHDRSGKKKLFVRNLNVQPFCPNGSLLDYSMTLHGPAEKIRRALTIYTDMAAIIQKITLAGGSFPDMKNSNWLILNDKLWIADDKSLRLRNPDGSLDLFSEQSQWYGDLVKSPEYMPPEMDSEEPILADPFQVFTWGKNLYEFLADTDPERPYFRIMEGASFNYDYPIFRVNPDGILLKQLIVDTVRANPGDRISLEEAVSRLGHIQLIHEVRSQIFSSLPTPIPYSILSQYSLHVLQLGHNELIEYSKNLTPQILGASLEPHIEAYRSEYQAKFSAMFQELQDILKICPHKDLHNMVLSAKIEHQTLPLVNYEQFAADLQEILDVAEALQLENNSSQDDENQSNWSL